MKVVVCLCGKIYDNNDESDHDCFYVEFENERDAITASSLVKAKEDPELTKSRQRFVSASEYA